MTAIVAGLADRKTTEIPDGYVERSVRPETQFHGGIAEVAQHAEILHLLRNLFVPLLRYADTQWSRLTFVEPKSSRKLTLVGHRQVLDALRKTKPAAARDAMLRHLTGTFRGTVWTREYFAEPRWEF